MEAVLKTKGLGKSLYAEQGPCALIPSIEMMLTTKHITCSILETFSQKKKNDSKKEKRKKHASSSMSYLQEFHQKVYGTWGLNKG